MSICHSPVPLDVFLMVIISIFTQKCPSPLSLSLILPCFGCPRGKEQVGGMKGQCGSHQDTGVETVTAADKVKMLRKQQAPRTSLPLLLKIVLFPTHRNAYMYVDIWFHEVTCPTVKCSLWSVLTIYDLCNNYPKPDENDFHHPKKFSHLPLSHCSLLSTTDFRGYFCLL